MNIILLGPPGAGKGTYAEELSKKYDIPHIATGDLLRSEVDDETELGMKAQKYMDKGELVPDELVLEILKRRLKKEDAKSGFLLDGFPRTIEQAKSLSGVTDVNKVINFQANKETILERLGGRLTCKKCGAIYHEKNIPPKVPGICDECGGELYKREDQKPEVIKKRLKEYYSKTEPVIDYYEDKGLLVNVDANRGIEKIDEIVSDCAEALSDVR